MLREHCKRKESFAKMAQRQHVRAHSAGVQQHGPELPSWEPPPYICISDYLLPSLLVT